MTIPKGSGGELASVGPDEMTNVAARIMAEHDVGALAVMDGKELVGILSERDMTNRMVARGRYASATRVRSVMTSPAITIRSDSTIDDALRLMADNHIRHLPLLDDRDRPVSMLSIRRLLGYRLEQLKDENYTLAAYVMADGIGG